MQAEARLEHLERLVQQLSQHGDGSALHGNTNSHPVADQNVNQEQSSIDSGAFVSNGPVFNGSTHWSAMLEDIHVLRSAIIPSEDTTSDGDIIEYEENIGVSVSSVQQSLCHSNKC